jgi:lysophospholipase L1-like esterase
VGEEDNMKRSIFNRMLKEKYGSRVFDLAGVESTYPDGAKAEFSKNNGKFAYLIPAYSDDGGHLNKLGKQRIAEELIRFLSNN